MSKRPLHKLSYWVISSLVVYLLINWLTTMPQPGVRLVLSGRVAADGSRFKIKQRNPVVNEGNQLRLTVIDDDGQPINDITWTSGSPDIATVDAQTGIVRGILQGFATITARRGSESFSVFLVVSRVRSANGVKVPGDTKLDIDGRLYISNPKQNVIMRADDALTAPLKVFAGKVNQAGQRDGQRQNALFAGPTALTVDNSQRGGIFITDTLNHTIRKIAFNGQVETLLGLGNPGISAFDTQGQADFAQAAFSSPRGIVNDNGGNLFVADTDNHAVYYIDFQKQLLTLLAGEPGQRGNDDGRGRAARFSRPAGLALSADGRLLSVADQDNNRVRLIELIRQNNGDLSGSVSTIGVAPGNVADSAIDPTVQAAAADEISFDQPQSVSFDSAGNIYVVDRNGVQVVTRPRSSRPQSFSLAQPVVTFNQAVSVIVRGTDAIVLDAAAADTTEALKIVSVGAPEINQITPTITRLEGNEEIIVRGQNFAPETIVIFGDQLIDNANIVSATELRFTTPPQQAPGVRSLSLLTRGGVAQKELAVIAKPVSALNVNEITTLAGGLRYFGDGSSALTASFANPGKVVIDSNGNIYLADSFQQRVRRIDAATNIITTIVGGGKSTRNGELANLTMIEPSTIALDGAGNLFVADRLTGVIRRVDMVSRTVTTVAGSGLGPIRGDGGPALQAKLGEEIQDITIDRNGDIYIVAENSIRRVNARTGIINTIAGNNSLGFSGDGGPAVNAQFSRPRGIAIDLDGNLLIVDTGNKRIRRVARATGIITTIVGNGQRAGTELNMPQPPTEVGLSFPTALNFDSDGNLIIVDAGNFLILKKKTGLISRIKIKNQFPPVVNNNAASISGKLIFTSNVTLQQLDIKAGRITQIAGGGSNLIDNNLALTASLGSVFSIAVDPAGNIFYGDFDSYQIRKIDGQTGVITVVAGNGESSLVGDTGNGGPATAARLFPRTIQLDKAGNIFVLEISTVRRIDAATGIITRYAGIESSFESNGDGGPATAASLGFSAGDIALDRDGNLFITADARVRRVDAKTGIITTIIGNGERTSTGDGGPANLATINAVKLFIDSAQNLYLSDTNKIRRVDARTNIITTVAGTGSEEIGGDGGLAINAGIGFARGLVVDQTGNIFLTADGFKNNNFVYALRRIDAQTNRIETILASNDGQYSGDGGAVTQASASTVLALAADQNGNLLVSSSDRIAAAIRLIKLNKD